MSLLGIHPMRAAILRYLAQHPEGATSGDIGRDLGVHYRTIWSYLGKLETEGGVTSEPASEGRSSHWRVYKLNREGRDEAIRRFLDYLEGKDTSE
ncbi:helix-turn-helix transcriptional regulator [Agromyces neolithicus]|uniref:Helix-turn-helix type 11 domain-containing protein n=1 Tax=Agromyces neolithicus TaxID=269420 RepID=A0ABN2ME52_9MICO